MSKLTFFLVTLIAAIPAGFLGYQAVMAFLNYSGEMPPVLMGVTGLVLLMCAGAVAMPVAALLRRSNAAPAATTPPAAGESGEFVADDEQFASSDDIGVDEYGSQADDEDFAEGGSEIQGSESEIFGDDDFDAFDDDEKR